MDARRQQQQQQQQQQQRRGSQQMTPQQMAQMQQLRQQQMMMQQQQQQQQAAARGQMGTAAAGGGSLQAARQQAYAQQYAYQQQQQFAAQQQYAAQQRAYQQQQAYAKQQAYQQARQQQLRAQQLKAQQALQQQGGAEDGAAGVAGVAGVGGAAVVPDIPIDATQPLPAVPSPRGVGSPRSSSVGDASGAPVPAVAALATGSPVRSASVGSGEAAAAAPPVAALPPDVAPLPTPATEKTPTPSPKPEPRGPRGTLVPLKWPDSIPYEKPDIPEHVVYDTPDEMTGLPRIKAASLEKLVERVTFAAYPDPAFLQSFMLTYRSFTTPKELLRMLKDRFMQPLPEGSEASVHAFVNKHQRPMRLRVFNVLKTWVTQHFHDFDDQELLDDLLNFAENELMQAMEVAAKSLITAANRAVEERNTTKGKTEFVFSSAPPNPILPATRNAKRLKLLDLHPLELARQLTLIEAELYRSIKPRECLNQSWNKKPHLAANILAMIERFNVVSQWVVSAVVSADKMDRCKTLTHFIETAEKCRQLNNYNASMAIMAGISDSALWRLKELRDSFQPKFKEMLKTLQSSLSNESNYKVLREALKTVEHPCIPYLGMYLTDLTFIEDGNNDNTGKLINFHKRNLISTIIAQIQQYQQTPYHLMPVPFIQEWLMSIQPLDKEVCYKLSLEIKPRGGKNTETQSSFNSPSAYQTATEAAKKAKEQEKNQPAQPAKSAANNASTLSSNVDPEWGEMEYIIGYRFTERDSDSNIRFTTAPAKLGGGQLVSAGTMEKLVERLTHEKYPDTKFIEAFMLTFRLFCTPKKLMSLLNMRFHMPKPTNPTVRDKWRQQKEMPVQLRVFNVLKIWVDKFPQDFLDGELSRGFMEFLKKQAGTTMRTAADSLQSALRKAYEGDVKKPPAGDDTASPQSLPLKKTANLAKPVFLDYQPEEVARQFALISFEKFYQLATFQVFSHYIKGKKKVPTLMVLLTREKQLTRLVRAQFASCPDKDEVLDHFTSIAKCSFDLKDFATAVGLVNVLQCEEITSVFSGWDNVNIKVRTKFRAISKTILAVDNVAHQRELLKNVGNSPCVPWIAPYGVHAQQLDKKFQTHVHGGLINFDKMRQLTSLAKEIDQYKAHNYSFRVVRTLAEELTSAAYNEPNIDEEMVEEVIRELIRTNGMVRARYRDMLKTRIRDKLQEEVDLVEFERKITKRKDELREQLTTLTSTVHCVSLPELEAAMDQIIEQQFPDGEEQQWQYADDTGIVYGWPHVVQVRIVHKDDHVFMCSVRPQLDRANIAMLLRVKGLYEHVTEGTVDKVVVVTGFASDVAQNIANHLGVAIFCCRPE